MIGEDFWPGTRRDEGGYVIHMRLKSNEGPGDGGERGVSLKKEVNPVCAT